MIPEQRQAIRDDLRVGRIHKPSMSDVERWMFDGGCEAACPDGCWVEPDGTCPHGRPSWLLVFGLI